MKKLLLVMLTFLAVITLSACSDICIGTDCLVEEEEEIIVTDEELADEAIETLFMDSIVIANLSLTDEHETYDVTWESDNESYFAIDGTVTRPDADTGNVLVTLTATLTVGEATATKEFEVTVIAEAPEATAEVEGLIYYDHINGHGDVVTDHVAYILFEEEMLGFVKYQVAYLACTCRPADVNFWNTMYIEVNKFTDDVNFISFGYDDPTSGHPYTAGMWGDSSPTPSGKTKEDFAEQFIPWFFGKTMEDLDGINVFKDTSVESYFGITNDKAIDDATWTDPDTGDVIDLIDDYNGSSVSTNNMLRIVQSILEYHEEYYGR